MGSVILIPKAEEAYFGSAGERLVVIPGGFVYCTKMGRPHV